jgi:ATP-dependent Lon protease
MEVLQLTGYTEEEKLAIAQQYLVPKELKENGLAGSTVTFQPKSIREIISYYTREAGVRNLEREIGSVCRKIAHKHLIKHAEDEEKNSKSSETGTIDGAALRAKLNVSEVVTEKSVNKYLGPRRHRVGMQNSANEIGICTGLAWTETGGDLLVVEVTTVPGKGKLTITGKLGDVMQESAQAAMSYVRSRAAFLELEEGFYDKVDIHIHVPEGAIPKDGPSAGLCMATALTSAFTRRPVSKDVAMTGEITLRGRALPIGGLKEKILAAHRGGITKIIIPRENEKDMAEIPKNILKDIKVVAVDHMDAVLMHALAWEDFKVAEKDRQDALFEKLKRITESEVAAGDTHIHH